MRILYIFFGIVILLGIYFYYNTPNSFPMGLIFVNNKTYLSYFALNLSQQEQGFMNATYPGLGNMVFVFNSTSNHCFWMHDTKFPLNVYWLVNGVVVYSATLPAESDTPVCHISNAVLESTYLIPKTSISWSIFSFDWWLID